MSKASEVAISLSVTGDSMTLEFTSTTQENAASPGEHQPVSLAIGDNTFTVPTGATGLTIVPGASSTVVKKLSGSSGFSIRPNAATYLALPTATATVVINASAIETLSLYWT